MDALYIDQDNERENEQQIRIMAGIYGRASRVLVWLGDPGNDSSERAIETIRTAARGGSHALKYEAAVLGLIQQPWFRRVWVRHHS